MVLCVLNQDEVTRKGVRVRVDRVGLTGHKRFFVFPDHLESVKVRELNSSAAKNLPACALVRLGYFSTVEKIADQILETTYASRIMDYFKLLWEKVSQLLKIIDHLTETKCKISPRDCLRNLRKNLGMFTVKGGVNEHFKHTCSGGHLLPPKKGVDIR